MEHVRRLCSDLGLRAFHAADSRRSWGPGYPDLTIAGPGGVLFRELKTARGYLTRPQMERDAQLPPSRPADRGQLPDDQNPWQDPGTPETVLGTASAQQLRALGILYRQLGITDDDTRHEHAAAELGVDRVGTLKVLSHEQAMTLIKALQDDLAKVPRG